MRFLQPKTLLVAFAALAITAASCKKDEPAVVPPVNRLVGSWNVDSVSFSVFGFPVTSSPTSSDLTLNANNTGTLRYAFDGLAAGFSDTLNVLNWSNESNSVTLVTSNSNGTDTTMYVRQVDEENRQQWFSSGAQQTVVLTRK